MNYRPWTVHRDNSFTQLKFSLFIPKKSIYKLSLSYLGQFCLPPFYCWAADGFRSNGTRYLTPRFRFTDELDSLQ